MNKHGGSFTWLVLDNEASSFLRSNATFEMVFPLSSAKRRREQNEDDESNAAPAKKRVRKTKPATHQVEVLESDSVEEPAAFIEDDNLVFYDDDVFEQSLMRVAAVAPNIDLEEDDGDRDPIIDLSSPPKPVRKSERRLLREELFKLRDNICKEETRVGGAGTPAQARFCPHLLLLLRALDYRRSRH